MELLRVLKPIIAGVIDFKLTLELNPASSTNSLLGIEFPNGVLKQLYLMDAAKVYTACSLLSVGLDSLLALV